jgi:hypothetical protein
MPEEQPNPLPPLDQHRIDPRFEDDSDSFFYMTDLNTGLTGLPFTVWIAYGSGVDHDVRIWAANKRHTLLSRMACFAIRPDVRVLKGNIASSDLELLRKWIGLNLPVLLGHWHGDLDSVEAIAAVRRI